MRESKFYLLNIHSGKWFVICDILKGNTAKGRVQERYQNYTRFNAKGVVVEIWFKPLQINNYSVVHIDN